MFKNKEYILSVYREKSFIKAAKSLYISQPSLSASVKRIEEKIGAAIFNRSTQPITLTEIGEQYIKCAKEMDKMEESFLSFVNDRLSLVKGVVKIGGSGLFTSCVLPPLISEFNKIYPHIHFEIVEGTTKKLMSLLLDGEIDIVVDNTMIVNDNVYSMKYKAEMMLLAAPAKLYKNEKQGFTAHDIRCGLHKSKDAPEIALETFSQMPFILLKPDNDTGKRAYQLCKKHGFNPKVLFELDQQLTAYNVCTTGMGLCFISDTLIECQSGEKDVLYYKLPDSEINRGIYFYTKDHTYLSTACKAFLDTISN